jgi:hypothetical protein
VRELWKNDKVVGKYKRRFYNLEGKKKCYYSGYNSRKTDDEPESHELDSTFSRKGGKTKKPKVLRLVGPPDIIRRKSFQKILRGEPLDYPFLTPFENNLLMLRALGYGWKRLARKFSGGRSGHSFKASRIKNILHDCYDKIRICERAGSVPVHIQYQSIFRKYKYRIKRKHGK